MTKAEFVEWLENEILTMDKIDLSEYGKGCRYEAKKILEKAKQLEEPKQ